MADLVIRADASASIGAGHVMRCLALAQRWTQGAIHFVGQYPDPALSRSLGEAGVVHHLERVHPDPADLAAVRALLARLPHAPVVLDGYHFTTDYQTALRQSQHRLLVIDDTAHLSSYDADIILNPNPAVSAGQYRVVGPTTFLLGPAFVLLRREFTALHGERRLLPPRAERLLVTFGAADPAQLTERVLAAWPGRDSFWSDVRVVIGPLNPREDRIRALLPDGATIVQGRVDMPQLLGWADLAISAAGGTCWELAMARVPAVLVAAAPNQIQIAEALAAAGAVLYAGRADDVDGRALLSRAEALACDYHTRAELRRCAALVDGDGASRVVKYIEG